MPRRHIVFQAFPATPITPVDSCRSSQPRTDPLFCGILRFVLRIPAVCSAESISLFCGIHRFVRRNPSVCTSENSGFHARNRWSTAWKPLASHEEHKGLPWGLQQQYGWVGMQNRPKKLHICLILPKICHSATLSVTSQPIVFHPLKPQVTDLQISSKKFLWYFSAI